MRMKWKEYLKGVESKNGTLISFLFEQTMKEDVNNIIKIYHNKNTHSNEYTTSVIASL